MAKKNKTRIIKYHFRFYFGFMVILLLFWAAAYEINGGIDGLDIAVIGGLWVILEVVYGYIFMIIKDKIEKEDAGNE